VDKPGCLSFLSDIINKNKIFKFMKGQRQAGYTLMEVLVVVSIISLLSSIVLVAFRSALAKARDARRLADMRQTVTALDLYYQKYGSFPEEEVYGEEEEAGSVTDCHGWDTSGYDRDGDGRPFLEPLIDEGIMASVPKDPKATLNSCSGVGQNTYRYHRYPYDYCTNVCVNKSFYVLGINNLETLSSHHNAATNHPGSQGWSCIVNVKYNGGGPRDWSAEFDWVVGKCE
jgi:prepilin-type N-terminal cleavage/methylation domain-containing protein